MAKKSQVWTFIFPVQSEGKLTLHCVGYIYIRCYKVCITYSYIHDGVVDVTVAVTHNKTTIFLRQRSLTSPLCTSDK